MKKVQKDIFAKTMYIIIGVFILLFIISYAFSKHFILSLPLNEEELIARTIENFNFVWLKISDIM